MIFVIGLVVVLIAIVTAFHCSVKYGRKGRYTDKIPGPVAFPIIGNAPQFIGSPKHVWNYMRTHNKVYYPIYRIWAFFYADINIRSPLDIEILMSSTKQIEKSMYYDLLHPWFGTGLLTSTGKKWHTRRKILTPAFHYSILQQFCNIFDDHSIRLVEELKKKQDNEIIVELLDFFCDYSLNTICETALGTPIHSQKDYCDKYRAAVYTMGEILPIRLVRGWLHFKWIFKFTEMAKRQADALETLHGFTKKIIKERLQYHRETNGKYLKNLSSESSKIEEEELYFKNSIHKKKRLAMLDLLIAASKESGEIDDAGIQEEVDTFLFEGHDTTAINLCFTTMLLAEHKDIQEKARREVDQVMRECDGILNMGALQKLTYLEMCIKEALRLYPSVPFISRKTTEDLQLTNYFIPAGVFINVHIFDCHRDPNFWPDPLKYDPDRFLPENSTKRHPYQYIPFSGGPRNCIGQKFALLENKNVLARLLHNFYFEPVDLTSEIDFQADLVLRTAHPIHTKFIRRNVDE